eukprot:3776445-Amphidinium_carterae.1
MSMSIFACRASSWSMNCHCGSRLTIKVREPHTHIKVALCKSIFGIHAPCTGNNTKRVKIPVSGRDGENAEVTRGNTKFVAICAEL